MMQSHLYMVPTGTPIHTPVRSQSPAHTHRDPWAHGAICCDQDHGASTSSGMAVDNHHSGYQHQHTISDHFSGRNDKGEVFQQAFQFPATGFARGGNHPQPLAGLSVMDQKADCEGECIHEAYCCDGDYCCDGSIHCEGSEECCEDPSCDNTAPCTDAHDCRDPYSHPPTDMSSLEQWADSKEGCTALQQLLECCNLPDCNIPVCPTDNNAIHPTPVDPLAAMFASMSAQPIMSTAASPSDLTPTSTVDPTTNATVITHTCHWGNCHLVFGSMPDLLAHVASDHLSAWGTGPRPLPGAHQKMEMATGFAAPATQQVISANSNFTSTPPQPYDASMTTVPSALPTPQVTEAEHLLACLWDNCLPSADMSNGTSEVFHPQTMGTQQIHNLHDHVHESTHSCVDPTHNHEVVPHAHVSASGEPFSPGTMLRHVLEEHLGVPGEIVGWPDQPTVNPQQAASLLDKNHHHHHVEPHHMTGHAHDHAHDHAHSHGHIHNHGHAHHHHHHGFPTPPSTVNTLSSDSPPASSGQASDKPLVCLWPGCPIGHPFADSASLMDHLSEVHIPKGKDSYVCHWDGCGEGQGRVFKSRQKVLRHLQSHTGHKPFVCGVCNQAFSEAAPLSAHMRRHAQQKPFKCDHPGCGKTFAVSSSLTIHMRTHNGEKPYICPHCGRGFVEASNLTKHIRTHTGERPFACAHPNCGKRFSRPDQLKRHMSVHDKPAVGNHARRRSSAMTSDSSAVPA